MTKVYEKGTIKVVWIEDDPEKIYSNMFENTQQAKKFAKDKKDSLVFKLVTHKNMKEFEWRLLPYGKHKTYKMLFKIHKARLI